MENEGQDKSCQTDFNLGILKEELSMAEAQIATLEQEVSAYKIDRKYFKTNNDRLQFYTGLPNIETLDAVFELIEPFISETSQSALSKFMQFILFLMRIRLNLSVEDLGYRVKISSSTVSRTFLNVLDVMFQRLSFLVKWPSHEILWETTPMCFRKHFKTKVCIIIHCFEVFYLRVQCSQQRSPPLDLSCLNVEQKNIAFNVSVHNRFSALADSEGISNSNKLWDNLKTSLNGATRQVCPVLHRNNRP